LANEVNFIPQIDYTSRDYSSIREDLINLIPTYAPEWTNRDPSDLGIALIEIFSYLGDLLNFYIDRAANEGFLATASQRDSVLQIAAMLNYTPTTSSPALVELVLSNSTTSAVTIPASTQVATTTIVDGNSVQIIFETDDAVVIPARVGATNGTETVTATQGYTIAGEVLGISTGSPNQIFKLIESPVIKDSVQVFVNGVQYTTVQDFTTGLVDDVIDVVGSDPVVSGVRSGEASLLLLKNIVITSSGGITV
jgi:hypothetical protein